MRSAFKRKAVLRRTVMSESVIIICYETRLKRLKYRCVPSREALRASQPPASRSCRTAAAECFKRPESAYTAFDRIFEVPADGVRNERIVGIGDRARHCEAWFSI